MKEHRMKAIAALSAGVFLMLSCSSPQVKSVKNDLSAKNLKGEVKSLTESRYTVTEDSGSIQKGELLFREISQYTKDGWLEDVKRVKPNGDVEYRVSFKHDDRGYMTESSIYKSDGSFLYKESYSYDDRGIQTGKSGYMPDGSIEHSEKFKYDSRDNMIEKNFLDPNGKLRKISLFKYDDLDRLIEKEGYNESGGLEYNAIFSYGEDVDKHGNWIIVTVFQNEEPTAINEREIEYY